MKAVWEGNRQVPRDVTDGNVQIIIDLIERLPRGLRLSHGRGCKNQYSSDPSLSCPFQCSLEDLTFKVVVLKY